MKNLTTRQSPQSVWDFMRELDRAFEESWAPTRLEVKNAMAFNPRVDVKETGEFYLISADLPGVPRDQIKVDFSDGRLTISGERSTEKVTEDELCHRVERQYGSFERSFQLPTGINEEKIQARFEDGVLEVMVPKAEISKPKSISIEGEKKGLFSKLLGKTGEGTKSEH